MKQLRHFMIPPLVGFVISLSGEGDALKLIVRDPTFTDLYAFELI